MATLVSAPNLPIPGQDCKITFGGLNPLANFVQLFPVSAPIGSSLRESIDAAKGEIAEIHSGPSTDAWNFTPDVGGVYTFKLNELTVRQSSGAQFEGDPSGSPIPAIVTTGNVVLYVGQRLHMTIGQAPDEVTLRVYVWDDIVWPTSIAVHDELTPALVDPTSPLAENASYDSNVLAAVSALSGETAADIAGTLSADFEVLRTWYTSVHLPGSEHTNQDDVNVFSAGWVASNRNAAEEAINQIRSTIESHTKQLVDAGDNEVHAVIDGETSYFSSGANNDPNTQFFALADAMIRLLDHAAVSAAHANVTIPGTISEAGPLTQICMRYIRALQSQTPTIPTAKNEGAAVLAQLAGFTEA